MKMPQIQQTGVPSAEYVTPSQIISGAQSKIAMGSSLVKMVSDYKSQMNKVEAVTQFNQHYNNSVMGLDEMYDNMLQAPQYDAQGNPTYAKLDSDWSKAVQQHVSETSKQFTNATARSKYQEEMGAYLRKSMADVRGVQRTRQKDYAVGQLNVNLAAFMRDANGAEKGVAAINESVTLSLIDFDKGSTMTLKFLNEHAVTQFNTMIEGATTEAELDGLRANLLTEPSMHLSANDIDSMFTAIRLKDERLEKEIEDKQEENYNNLIIQMFDGQVTDLTQLQAEFSDNKLSAQQYDDLKNRLQTDMSGPEIDDWGVVIQYKTNLEDISETEILTNSSLTRATRLSLVTERRQLVKQAEAQGEKYANWTTTQEGKLALETIVYAEGKTVTFNIQGMAVNTDAKIFDLKRKLFAELDKVPVEERRYKAVEIADRLVAEFRESQNKAGEVNHAGNLMEMMADADPSEYKAIIRQYQTDNIAAQIPAWLKTISTKKELQDMIDKENQ